MDRARLAREVIRGDDRVGIRPVTLQNVWVEDGEFDFQGGWQRLVGERVSVFDVVVVHVGAYEHARKNARVEIVRDQNSVLIVNAHAEVNDPVDDALKIGEVSRGDIHDSRIERGIADVGNVIAESEAAQRTDARFGKVRREDRKSTRLNSSHITISYAVFCLKKKKKKKQTYT